MNGKSTTNCSFLYLILKIHLPFETIFANLLFLFWERYMQDLGLAVIFNTFENIMSMLHILKANYANVISTVHIFLYILFRAMILLVNNQRVGRFLFSYFIFVDLWISNAKPKKFFLVMHTERIFNFCPLKL